MDTIAIVGAACLFPEAHSLEQFWQLLLDGRSAGSPATARDLGIDPALIGAAEHGGGERLTYLEGGFIRDFAPDLEGYQLAPAVLRQLDSSVQWAAHVGREALRDSGYLEHAAARSRTGLILGAYAWSVTRRSVGLFSSIYQRALAAAARGHDPAIQAALRQSPAEPASPLNGLLSGYLASVVAQALGLGQVRFTLDAACASSLYGVRLACGYLQQGQADLMLVGAVSRGEALFESMGFSVLRAFPETGRSQPLDAGSQGLMRSEGASMVALKRYRDALRDGDHIYATIAGIGLSNDGRGRSLLSPNKAGQLRTFERAYASAGLPPEAVDYIECHATGTPLGDQTELDGIEAFFGASATPLLIGSVKSNLGHLLTCAGMASLLKVILGMEHGLIPATVGVSTPLSAQGGRSAGAQIVRATTPWPAHGARRRAAINAFGFGGTNAHLIVEQPAPPPAGSPAAGPAIERGPAAQTRLAITGMEAIFGPCESLAAFAQRIAAGTPHAAALPEGRWRGLEREQAILTASGLDQPPPGAYLEELRFNAPQYRIPPSDSADMNPAQLLLLKVADSALRDAEIKPGAAVAVIVAMGAELAAHQLWERWSLPGALDPALPAGLGAALRDRVHGVVGSSEYLSVIGNVMAGRIAALWDFSGPTFTVSAEERSTFSAIELAELLLAAGEVEAVLVGAVDLAGGPEQVLLRSQLDPASQHGPAFSFGRGNRGWAPGEGAGAVVLTRLDHAIERQAAIYATLDGRGVAYAAPSAQGGLAAPSAEAVAAACSTALIAAGLSATDIGYVEAHASGIQREDAAELAGLLRSYPRPAGQQRSCALGSAKAVIGHTFAASGMASLIKTVLCLSQRILPGLPAWQGPEEPAAWEQAAFYIPGETRPWVIDAAAGRRIAAISGISVDGTATHLVVGEPPADMQRHPCPAPVAASCYLLPILADDLDGMEQRLQAIQQQLLSAASPVATARQCLELAEGSGAPFAAVLVGSSIAELRKEIQSACQGIPAAIRANGEWKTPRGSFFTARPLGRSGQVAFVYPGAFNSYPGLGRSLLCQFPALQAELERRTSRPGEVLRSSQIYPRSVEPLSRRDLEALEEALQHDAAAMINSGVGFSTLYTALLREILGLQPAAALGYSLGEITMLLSLGVWQDMNACKQALDASELFKTRLSGPRLAVCEQWGTEAVAWGSYILMAAVDEVEAALAGRQHIYLTHINTPGEVAIAGDDARCQELIAALGCEYLRAPADHVLHVPEVASERAEIASILRQPIADQPGITFYSAASYAPAALDERQSDSIAQALSQSLDFPRLIRRASADGITLFIEVGPGSACTRWIGEILHDTDHCAIALNRRGLDDDRALMRALAVLISQRVPLRLAPLLELLPHTQPPAPTERVIRLGGPALTELALPKMPTLVAARPADALPTAMQAAALMSESVPAVAAPRQALQSAEQAAVPALALQAQLLASRVQAGMAQSLSAATRGHALVLGARQHGLRQMAAIVQAAIGAPAALPPQPAYAEQAVLEFTEGQLARVFGPAYAELDALPRRTRLPSPPFLSVSRVMRIDGPPRVLGPAAIETEFDIPQQAWFTTDGQTPFLTAIDAQGVLFLISYLGIDFLNRGQRVYRLLDAKITFHDDLPREGDSLRFNIDIESFVRSGDTTLFFADFHCGVGARSIMSIRRCCAGFFTYDELESGQGILVSDEEQQERNSAQIQTFAAPLTSARRSFSDDDLRLLSQGELAGCFGAAYAPAAARNPSLRLPPSAVRLLDRVVELDPHGGPWGLGSIVGEKSLAPDHWYLRTHFKDDPVLAGPCMMEGCFELLQFYALYLGLASGTAGARFQPIPERTFTVRFRGQVPAVTSVVTYQLEVTEIGLGAEPYLVGNFHIMYQGKRTGYFTNMGLRLAGPRQQ